MTSLSESDIARIQLEKNGTISFFLKSNPTILRSISFSYDDSPFGRVAYYTDYTKKESVEIDPKLTTDYIYNAIRSGFAPIFIST